MRVKPAPGNYVIDLGGHQFPMTITEDGATISWEWEGLHLTWEWEWFEMSAGPALMPTGGIAVSYIGFDAEGNVAVVLPDGSGKEGTYAPA